MYGEKVYYIDDRGSKSSKTASGSSRQTITDGIADAVAAFEEKPVRLAARKTKNNKNPGLAAFLSTYVWGLGQIYADRLVPGMLFLILQGVITFLFAVTPAFAEALVPWIRAHHVDESMLLTGAAAIFAAIAVAWYGNVVQAYRSAQRERRGPFEGVDSVFSVILGEGLVPGLGQLLNGQFRKGVTLLFISMLWLFSGMLSLFAVLIWKHLEQMNGLYWGEICLLAFPAFSIVGAGALLIGFVDAVKTNLYPERRASLWKRFKWSFNRLRTQGLFESVLPLLKRTALALLLILAGNIGIYFFPRDFYQTHLQYVVKTASAHRMTVIPMIVMTLQQTLAGEKAAPPQADASEVMRAALFLPL